MLKISEQQGIRFKTTPILGERRLESAIYKRGTTHQDDLWDFRSDAALLPQDYVVRNKRI